jgi:hypothetical protein
MTRLALTENRLPDLPFDGHSDSTTQSPNGYRFGRISGMRARSYAGRAVSGLRALVGAMLKILAAAKIRRIERELRIRGIRYDSVRFDGNRFTADADESSAARR